ncbi:MAG: hypothetical protein ACT4SY_05680 [Hyphomicrobiales bacterium]
MQSAALGLVAIAAVSLGVLAKDQAYAIHMFVFAAAALLTIIYRARALQIGERQAAAAGYEDGVIRAGAIAFDSNGHVLVLEHGPLDQAAGFKTDSGRLLDIDGATGGRQIVLDGLTRPASVLVWDEDKLVISELAGSLHFPNRESTD